jgi:hypothetical protein
MFFCSSGLVCGVEWSNKNCFYAVEGRFFIQGMQNQNKFESLKKKSNKKINKVIKL